MMARLPATSLQAVFGLALAIALLSLACGGDGKSRLEEGDSGGTFVVETGDTLEVVLEGNPTTGFTWEVVSLDASVLSQQGEAEFEPESDLVGAGGEFTFRFAAVAPGSTALEIIYHRPFETEPPERTFSVTVTVE